MSDPIVLQGFLGKWRARWPEWAIAEAFLSPAQRPLAQAWLALRAELLEAAWGGEDPTPGAAKLGWWEEELRGWARGARRHPLGLALQKQPLDWAALAAVLPVLRLRRVPEDDRTATLAGLAPLAAVLAPLAARLFDARDDACEGTSAEAMAEALLAEWVLLLPQRGVPAAGTAIADLLALPAPRAGVRVERIHAALVRGRLRRIAAGRRPPIPAPAALLVAWRGARG
ncbi:phytoene/squalene synthase family protein [Thermomonas alba]|uniref:phytoene/squalene synthase family protein n=1 Tax=Thermomonas alba TaxID=2888525 RepID=UPI001F0330CA|nr:phytoene/squalene synthase family protein [Thermomonas alba]